jgi:hypothetical protein
MLRVSVYVVVVVVAGLELSFSSPLRSHIHVSIKDKSGRNIFALTPEEIANGGRKNAPFKDVQYISQIGEYFLAGVLEGLPDGKRRAENDG